MRYVWLIPALWPDCSLWIFLLPERKEQPQNKILMVRRKHPQPATVLFASRITVCCWIHNNFSVRLFGFFDSKHNLKNTDRETPEFFSKTQWKVMGIHILRQKVLFELMCILTVFTTAVPQTWVYMAFITFGKGAGQCTGQQWRSVPSSAAFLWLLVTTETSQPCLLTAAQNNCPWWQQQHICTNPHPKSRCAAFYQLCCDLPVTQI